MLFDGVIHRGIPIRKSFYKMAGAISLVYRRELMMSTTVCFLLAVSFGSYMYNSPGKGRTLELTSWFQAGTSHQESVHIWLLGQLPAVLLADATAVDDPGVLCRRSGDFVSQPLADGGVDFLCLGGGRDFAGADGPGRNSVIRDELVGRKRGKEEEKRNAYQMGS
jgi:hypothetical protein